jgi:hypothetical protein
MESQRIYLLTVTHSEPQVVDMKRVHYTPCEGVKSPRIDSSPMRKIVRKKSSIEILLTEQIKRRESFDKVYEVFSKTSTIQN